jgi:dissimilatory sulfite reductase (desulfoviridin) alpha/beta subunit
MKWTPEAEAIIKQVPFFVRKRVRARVEDEARQAGKSSVAPADVKATQKRYLTGMSKEVKGYRFERCFGPSGCPHRIQPAGRLAEGIVQLLQSADLLNFLKSRGVADLKFYHEFRVTLADCPNACSQPQIKDIGIIAAALPALGDAVCSQCRACTDICREAAISLEAGQTAPTLHNGRCMACGQCVPVCPTGTLVEGDRGFRIQLGGKLGRHPRLGLELPGIYTEKAVLAIVADSLALYKERSRHGERFGELIGPADVRHLAERYAQERR